MMNEIFKLIAESGRTDLMEEWYKIEKVLTILHDKEVILECVKVSSNYKEYITAVQRVYGNVYIEITEQEYNLIKEWLENEKINSLEL